MGAEEGMQDPREGIRSSGIQVHPLFLIHSEPLPMLLHEIEAGVGVGGVAHVPYPVERFILLHVNPVEHEALPGEHCSPCLAPK